MPFKGEQEVVFPQDSYSNVLLIYADNMRGKTSFLNALRWCFYGEAIERNRRVIEPFNIVNWDAADENEWEVSVDVKFELEEIEYELVRELQRKPMIHIPKRSSDLEIKVALRKDGKVIKPNEITHEINQIIPKDIARFFLFDGELLEEYEELVKEEASEKSERIKEEIEKVLGVPAFLNARDHLGVLLSKARTQQGKDAKDIKSIKSAVTQCELLEKQIKDLKRDLKLLEGNKNSNRKRITKLKEIIEEFRSVHEDQKDYEECKSDLSKLEKKQDILSAKKRDLLKEAWKDVISPLVEVKKTDLEKSRDKLIKPSKEEYKLEGKIEALESVLENHKCPTCTQDAGEEIRIEIKNNLEKLQAGAQNITSNNETLNGLQEKIRNLSAIKKTSASTEIPGIEKDLRSNSLDINKLDTERERLKKELSKHDTVQIKKDAKERDGLLILEGEIKTNIEDCRRNISVKRERYNVYAAKIDKDNTAKKMRSSRLVEAYKGLKLVFEDSISTLRDSLRFQVQKHATETFKELTTEQTYKGLKINKNYGLSIIDEKDREVTLRSSGAEEIVALSLVSGLNLTARKSAPIIMDTAMGRLDNKHRENLLRFIPDVVDQAILLVHEGEIRKEDAYKILESRIGGIYNIERVSSSQSKISKD